MFSLRFVLYFSGRSSLLLLVIGRLHKLQGKNTNSAMAITVVITVVSSLPRDRNYIRLFLHGFCISFSREILSGKFLKGIIFVQRYPWK